MTEKKPPFEKTYAWALVLLISYFIADIVILKNRDLTLPQKPPEPKMAAPTLAQNSSRANYNTIIARNLFSSEGKIPDPITEQGQPTDAQQVKDEEPVASSLPLTLVGTIVISSKPEKSLASIEVKSKNQIFAYTPNQNLEGLATLMKVERRKIVIRNLNNNRLEFIEMKADSSLSFNRGKGGGIPAKLSGSEIKKESDTNFSINRSDLLKYTNDLSSVLQQARAVPHRSSVTGEVDGFSMMDIQPGSVFEKLGLQRLDIIKGVNGDPVDSPAKAMQLYNALKNSPGLALQIERNGKTETLNYTINQ